MNLFSALIVFILIFLELSITKFVKFQENVEYLYELNTDIEFKNVGKFKLKGKVSIISFIYKQIAKTFFVDY